MLLYAGCKLRQPVVDVLCQEPMSSGNPLMAIKGQPQAFYHTAHRLGLALSPEPG